jgi:hypothetical protein
MTDVAIEPRDSLPQSALRGFVVGAMALLMLSVPIFHLAWHGVLGRSEPLLHTRSQVATPPLTLAGLRDGSWMIAKARQLREDSPIAWWLGAVWNELRYRIGAPVARLVHFGRDDWFFVHDEITHDRAGFARASAARQAFLAQVKAEIAAVGAELVIALVPDKATVYPEQCHADGRPSERPDYAALRDEFGQLGIPVVDVLAAMVAQRAVQPGTELYYRRDTHWRPMGALTAGRATAQLLEARFGDRLGPRVGIEIGGATSMRLVGDMPAHMGIGCILLGDTGREPIPTPMSLLAWDLAESREYYGINLRTPAGPAPVDDSDAKVLLAGTSFAEENGRNAIAVALGRPVRARLARGASALAPLRLVLDDLAAGARPVVVVWEIVERGMFSPEWWEPKR